MAISVLKYLYVQGNRKPVFTGAGFEDFCQLGFNGKASLWRSPVTNLASGFPEQKLAKGVAGLFFALQSRMTEEEINRKLIILRGDYGDTIFKIQVSQDTAVMILPVFENAEDGRYFSHLTLQPNILECSAEEILTARAVFRARSRAIDMYYEICVLDSYEMPWTRTQLLSILSLKLTKSEIDKVHNRIKRLTCIYLISDGATGLTKIGKSDDPERRLKQLIKQDTLLPRPNDFSILHCWEDYPAKEPLLHDKFADKRVRGEWFRLDDEDIQTIRSIYTNG